jgi:hypothetical protein
LVDAQRELYVQNELIFIPFSELKHKIWHCGTFSIIFRNKLEILNRGLCDSSLKIVHISVSLRIPLRWIINKNLVLLIIMLILISLLLKNIDHCFFIIGWPPINITVQKFLTVWNFSINRQFLEFRPILDALHRFRINFASIFLFVLYAINWGVHDNHLSDVADIAWFITIYEWSMLLP